MAEKTFEKKLMNQKKKDEILAIKDISLKQQGIKENIHLFEKGGKQ